MKNICISGIHTDAGKSHVSAALCYAFGYEYFKLIQAGALTDESFVKKTAPHVISHAPGIMLQTPASPHVGMIKENVKFDGLSIKIPKDENVLTELAGGLFCPLDENAYMIDFMAKSGLPTFLVARNYLGSINHTVLSIEALKARNIEILGVIFSQIRDEMSQSFLQNKYKDLNFFVLEDFDLGFEKVANNLKEQILRSGVKL
ncbi:dethiobiotin synthetase [Campylobacter iguaniorum]|uniref:ATP-dependent dethiobiotin synthetase BioD n=1 Tax=Campylobacter iguaniorum TaxID=1244531 RepID=UPI0007C92A30|nr:ATP-dependent dethiobiotin synthetase BioD [Campylobacter iguaniorum]ANE35524.1 dethiobiotin synthetase [Campylobacter iguaniorum]